MKEDTVAQSEVTPEKDVNVSAINSLKKGILLIKHLFFEG
jgi:hypothetical protein